MHDLALNERVVPTSLTLPEGSPCASHDGLCCEGYFGATSTGASCNQMTYMRYTHDSSCESEVSSSHSTTSYSLELHSDVAYPRRVVGFKPMMTTSMTHGETRVPPGNCPTEPACSSGELKRQLMERVEQTCSARTNRGHPTKVICLRPLEEQLNIPCFASPGFVWNSDPHGILETSGVGSQIDGALISRSLPIEIPVPRARGRGDEPEHLKYPAGACMTWE